MISHEFSLALAGARHFGCVAAVAIASITFASPGQASNLLVNGSFEIGPDIPLTPSPGLAPGLVAPGGGDTSILGWTVIAQAPGGTIDYISTYWQHSDGARSIDLNGSPGPGGIEQTFSTVPGQLYEVLFDMAGNPTSAANPIKSMEVVAAGQSQLFYVDNTGHTLENMGWATFSWTFQASAAQTTLQFLMVFPFASNEGIGLDNVRVSNVVPEPSSVVLAAFGLIGIVGWRGRRTR